MGNLIQLEGGLSETNPPLLFLSGVSPHREEAHCAVSNHEASPFETLLRSSSG
jgi:hypothetical protein